MEIVCRSSSPTKLVLVIHSWWGLTQSFRDYAELLSVQGYAVGLSDLFDGRTASNIADAKLLRRAPRKVPKYKSLISNINELLAFGGGSTQTVSVIGFSMGGHWAVWLSQQPDIPVRSSVVYYAARGGNFAQSRSSFLAHFAENDAWVSKSARRNMQRKIIEAKCSCTVFDYPGTSHWFAESSQLQDYNAPAAQLALERTIAHINSV